MADDFVPDLNFDEVWNSPPQQDRSPSVMPPPPRTVAPPEEAQRARNEADSGCVIHCCQLINDLESYIVVDMGAFQILSGIVRKAIESLNKLIGQQQGSRNLRCLMLFCTICYQSIELLHICHKTIAAPGGQRRASMLMPGGLGLGGFGYDEEEQSEWQVQRVLKEIHQGHEMVRKIKFLAGIGPEHTTAGATPEAAAREHCFGDIEQKFKDLAAKVKRET
jgi:hypothetical protein